MTKIINLNNFKLISSISAALFLGKISGFLRDWLVVKKMGANLLSDFALILITIPDLMVSLLIGGGFAAAVIPEFKSIKKDDAYRLFLQLFLLILILFSLLAFLLSYFSINFIYLLAPGLPLEFIQNNIQLFWVTTIAIPLTACSGIVKAKLDSYNLFLYGAFGTLIFNVSIIFLIFFPFSLSFMESVAIGILIGAFVRILMQSIGISKIRRTLIKNDNHNRINRKFLLSLFKALTFSSLLFLLPIISRAIASTESEGSFTLFNFSYVLNELPITLIFGAILTILLTKLSEMHNNGSLENLTSAIAINIKLSILISLSICIPIIFYSYELTEFIFSSTNLTEADISSISMMVMISYCFLPFRALISILFPILSAINGLKNLLLISILMISTLLFSSLILINNYGLNGIMIAYGLTNLVGTFFMLCLLYIKLGINVFIKIFRSPLKSFLMPILASMLINYIGVSYFSGALGMIFFGFFSAIIFFLVFNSNDKESLFRSFSKENYS